MKTIGKLSINPEKLIKNEELVNLKGGYEFPPETGNCFYHDYWVGSVHCPECGLPCLDECQSAFPEYYITRADCYA